MQFPRSQSDEIQLWITFEARKYTNRQEGRAGGGGRQAGLGGRDAIFSATLPVPPNMSSSVSANYERGETAVNPLIEGTLALAGEGEGRLRVLGSFVSKLPIIKGLSPGFIADLTTSGYFGAVDMDQSEMRFTQMEHRNFQFNFNMIAKNNAESAAMEEIANGFEVNALPSPSRLTNEKMFHPPLWSWYVMSKEGRQFNSRTWAGQPQTSVLTDVRVNRTAAGGAYATNNGKPMAVNLALNFTELEPSLRDPDGTRILSRSRSNRRASF
tara:strand:- start:239 stop:1045 length:807 start_codon:yes stop_codon:yes gene_type:complete